MSEWMVYFARCIANNGADMGAVKIGCSWHPTHRLADIVRNEPYDLELLATCPGDMFQESAIHMWFRRYRIGGEFFSDHEDILKFAADANRLGRVPLPISQAMGFWLTCAEVEAFIGKHGITVEDIAAAGGSRVASVISALKKPKPNRRVVAAVCVAAMERGIKVAWHDFRAPSWKAAA